MSFESLNKDELTKVAEFFNKDVVAADEDKGPTKKELIAALASDDGSEPVSWDDYKDIYLKADDESESEDSTDEEQSKDDAETADEPEPVSDDVSDGEMVLIKMDRKNGTFETHGMRFSKDHPYRSVPADVAEEIVEKVPGFRMALPSEVRDYYN